MKKSFPTNINGKIFYIDEDAYSLLQNYLSQLHATFVGSEGEEIVADIESRISELFEEKINAGAHVIIISDVNTIIETMGRPEDISDSVSPEDTPHAEADGKAGNGPRPSQRMPFISVNLPGRKRIFRNMQNKVFGGVFGGLAAFLDWDSTIMRILYVVLAIFTAPFVHFWPYVILYLLAWMIIPPARTPRQILEMHGEPVNIDTVGQTILSTSPTPPPYKGSSNSGANNFFSTIMSVFAKCIIGFLGLMGGLIAIGCTVAILTFATALISHGIFDYDAIFESMELLGRPHFITFLPWVVIVWCLVAIIPAIALVWTAACVLFNCAGVSRPVIISAIIVEVVLIAAGIVLTMILNSAPYHHLSMLLPATAITVPISMA